ncbi:MAG: PSD1 and planctomycete cytochrome C domain-containing protein [Planctomycetota bacterium]
MSLFPRIGMFGSSFLVLASVSLGDDTVDFNRDIRPILANHCFKCHGPDDKTREAGVRFDVREAALAVSESGGKPIVPGKPAESGLIQRIHSLDEDVKMPPPSANKPLTPRQKELLEQWIVAGAPYASHWAFVPPLQAPIPAVKNTHWPRNAIDYFVLSKMEREGLQPSAEADKHALVRRVYLDLVGLPPTVEEIHAFVQDSASDAYEKLVDRLLASPHYGERWARRWLDLARYADTNGYEKDRPRSIWPYRDWVIQAINADMPFDQFTIEQLAGDMLPGATETQRIATGMHRNTMLNEEGGIDPLEFRYYAVVDRVNTTGTVWLGLTFGCAQCHSHKYDPVTQRDYYQVMAFLNNADEPETDVRTPEITKAREQKLAEIADREAALASRYPPDGDIVWRDVKIVEVLSAANAVAEHLEDGSVRMSGPVPAEDTYTVVFDANLPRAVALQVEAIADESLPSKGPGRTPHGNFVLTEISASVQQSDRQDPSVKVSFANATADFSQTGFPPTNAFDGDQHTGWAIHGTEPWNVNRTATFTFMEPVESTGLARWTITLDQKYGGSHMLGRFRIRLGERLGERSPNNLSEADRRKNRMERDFQAWLQEQRQSVVAWEMLKPVQASSEIPSLDIQTDGSILASGDQSKRDIYQLTYEGGPKKITALRLEVLPDENLPKGGPGRIAYEGPFGDFFLSEFTVRAKDHPVKIKSASHSYASDKNTAAAAIDGDPQTGWSINGGQGRAHVAVFTLAEPIEANRLDVQLLFERYYAAGLGRFKLWATSQERPVAASTLPTHLEPLLAHGDADLAAADRQKLLAYFLLVSPTLAGEHAEIEKLRKDLPSYPTTLVMQERPAEHPRKTFVRKRGEFLQPTDPVDAMLPSMFEVSGAEGPKNRLEFARWLVSRDNPLAARVAVNRYWAIFFGRGITRTTEDFGYQGEAPTHPELLDWLAVEFQNRGWSVKQLHRLIVTSATYRQSSRVTPMHLEKDPQNKWLSRAPRVRLDAEQVRDVLLCASGLLSRKIGGPSVFPPQPPGITAEGTYGPLEWKVSTGEDRYRRGLYTFSKRTAPYAMSATFDAPSGEACVARRDVSNTPLQALTLLNDSVALEAAQALSRLLLSRAATDDERIDELYLRCLGRPPQPVEKELLLSFHRGNLDRLERKELDEAKIAGGGEGEPRDRAAWTLTARAVLNLDAVVTKE